MDVIGKIRQVRTEMNIEPSRKIHVFIQAQEKPELLRKYEKEILLLTRSERIEFVPSFPANVPLARGVISGAEIAIDLAGAIDVKVERERLQKELKKIETDLSQTQNKLRNENFLRNAPAEVVAEQKARENDLTSRKIRTEEHIRSLQ
jgi:valyl-tRNA synthetase